MSAVKKFGTFAGVFTPSVLTILGVIMYMRLGWVVGQAGLIGTIIIILVAHIISISTGLSISSIATDKKIKTGGIYYILSRSLGLPMGGAIGITLFVGTALSIALYIVGFTENFLGLEVISNFLGMENNINSIRIVGTLVLLLLFMIAFISTSLAIKSQFFVLGAIALSLISIVLGFIFKKPEVVSDIVMSPVSNHFPMITIFAIFFPAVTGFTAGVAMSGDLLDPKKSIPKGTMLAIITGLVVYISLAVGIGFFVSRDMLLNDSNFLLKIAIYAPLVIAGIWGATLSSALGGILGGPRILQAISNDKIGPKFLGKGYGASNEPRNALIFTFFLAEIGILIGELDVIAEVVSMFYIAAYGFINLAFALEKWASSDFRPSFSISKWIGIIGFLASFGVMLQLNPGAMFAAFVIMWLIYFYLKRRELKSDFGDVWGSVWSSMVRTSITKLSEKSLEKRNWKPNILLFSGDMTNRPYLLEFGKQLVGKYGFLSHFELEINPDNQFKFTKREQLVASDDQSKGVFSRRHSVTNLYDGIEQIASTYGFVEVEPNTVFLGWARNSKEPVRFAQMLTNLYQLDLNVILMDYDHRYGYGDRKQIDVWWRGRGQNGNLALNLVKFIQESEEWAKANVRLMVVNPFNDEYENLYRQATDIFHDLRIDGEVRIINNQIENRSFYEIIRVESLNSSLILMGIPEILPDKEKEFVETTNDLCHKIGTVILVKASSQFSEISIANPIQKVAEKSLLGNIDWTSIQDFDHANQLEYPKQEELRAQNANILHQIQTHYAASNEHYLQGIAESENLVLTEFKLAINRSVDSVKLVIEKSLNESLPSKLSSIHTKAFRDINAMLENLQNVYVPNQKLILGQFVDKEHSFIKHLFQKLPKKVKVNYSKVDLVAHAGDSLDVRWFKFSNRFLARFKKTNFRYNIRYQHLLVEEFLPYHVKSFDDYLQQLGFVSTQNVIAIESFVTELDKEMQRVYQLMLKSEIKSHYQAHIQRMHQLVDELEMGIQKRMIDLLKYRNRSAYLLIDELNRLTSKVLPDASIDEEFNINKRIMNISNIAIDITEQRMFNQNMLINHLILNVNLLIFGTKLRQLSKVISQRLINYFSKDVSGNRDAYLNYLKSYYERYQKDKNADFIFDNSALAVSFDSIKATGLINFSLKSQVSMMKYFPQNILIFNEESTNLVGTDQQFETLETVNLSVSKVINYLLQDEFNKKLGELILSIPDQIMVLNYKLQEHLRQLQYYIESNKKSKEDFSIFIENDIKRIEEQALFDDEFIHETLLKIEERQRIITDKIAIYPFVQTALNLKQYIKQRDSKVGKSKLMDWQRDVYKKFRNKTAQLWYQQSKGFTALDLSQKTNLSQMNLRRQNQVIGSLKAPKIVFDAIPFYYKQLFMNRQNFMSEFWINRKLAEKEIYSFIADYQNGMASALMISGLLGSGKSYLSYKLAASAGAETKVYTIIPPANGSVSLLMFNQVVQEALETEQEAAWDKLSPNSLVIFEDAELWWRKSADGFVVLDEIHRIIKQYATSIRFAVVMNSTAYEFISQLKPMDLIYSHLAVLEPIDARSLENVLWKRHLASGLKLKLAGKAQDSFHAWDFAHLFTQYFRFSKGYPATAMAAWINNITAIENQLLEIRTPLSIDKSIFDSLEEQDLLLLQLFLLHKQMDFEKFSAIMAIDQIKVKDKLLPLHRSGFIELVDENIYQLNPLLLPNIIQVLKSKKYL